MAKNSRHRRNAAPSQAKKPRNYKAKPALGTLLESFRISKDMTMQQLAEESGVSASMIASIEVGRKAATDRTLNQLSAALELTPGELKRLQDVRDSPTATDPLPLIAGLYVSAERLMEREARTDITTAWVLDPYPLELRDESHRQRTAQKLTEKKYVFFLPDVERVNYLRDAFERLTQPDIVREAVTFVTVPSSIRQFFFCPAKAFWKTKANHWLGIWAFRGPHGDWVDGGFLMDEATMTDYVNRIDQILFYLMQSSKYELDLGVFEKHEKRASDTRVELVHQFTLTETKEA